MEKITFCIPSKNNLRYLKTCIPSIRKNSYRKDHDIIIFVDSDHDGTVDWLNENKGKYNLKFEVNPDLNNSLFGIGKAYDRCIELAETEVIMIFHADMMLGKSADLNAFNLLDSKTVVCATRIEPPLHPNGGEKIIQDFGIWPEDFKEVLFDEFVVKQLKEDKVTEGIFAPWMIYKDEFLSIGGHDPILKSAREDSDVFNRLSLDGFTFKQPWNSLVYHLTGRGGQFQHGDIQGPKDEEWQKLMNNSTKEFIRKWGSGVKHTPLMLPIVSPKYNIGIILKNGNETLVRALEPWSDTLYVDGGNIPTLIKHYIDNEQPNTAFDLFDRLKPYDNEKNSEILVEVDGTTFNQQDFKIITQLSDIIKDSGSIGRFKLSNVVIEIIQMNEYQNKLIKL
tara:strand:+ start:228 stop:1406 length:1179 start_codon:yes stop_codon:yes gene_type:complete